tara:strand:+ start:1289 stop:1906 length:618 start_codon:yes stop_codon:yes gene_type:complete
MLNTNNISSREKLLFTILAFLVGIFLYVFFRFGPLSTEMQRWDERISQAEQNVPSLIKVSPQLSKEAEIKEKIEELQKFIDREESNLQGFRAKFINLNQPDAIPLMRSEITKLISKIGLRIVSIKKSSLELSQLAGRDYKDNAALLRPQFDMVLKSDYFQISKFLDELQSLDFYVVVTKLSIFSTLESEFVNEYYPLETKITLAF